MSATEKYLLWFEEVHKEDVGLVGGKGANLGEMINAHIPVPPGFIVTSTAYYEFIKKAGISEKIRELLQGIDVDDSKQLQRVAERIQQVMFTAILPRELQDAIKQAYVTMGKGLVAVRSSATAEDLPEASFAGQQSTFLNVNGEEAVIRAVQKCWASLFSARAIFYRVENRFDHLKVGIAVPVQRMVESDASGVMFTAEPINNDRNRIVIEAIEGLGEAVVSGDVTPDHYVLNKEPLLILNKEIKKQEWKLVKNNNGDEENVNIRVPLSSREQSRQKITDADILLLAEIGKRLEDHYNYPQDVEWARENGRIYIVQTRPITTLKEVKVADTIEVDAPVLLSGSPASPGIASGSVRIVRDPSQIDKVTKGDILVAEMTTPDFVPAMKRAVAIITDRGGRTAHAAIVSRELGIPCIVGTGEATTILKDGQIISVDGSKGKVYSGRVQVQEAVFKARNRGEVKTRTKLLVNLAQPDLAERVAQRDVDGIGLLRAEFMVAEIGEHPSYMITEGRGQEFVDKLAKGLIQFAKSFYPRQVVYRTNDFKTNEYRALKGGDRYEAIEENPMLGYRGASRYIADVETFKLEIKAIKKVREEYDNLWGMIPFVRTPDGLGRTIRIMEEEGLGRSDIFKLWMMVEVPSNVILLEKFIDVGIDGISIGSNDLTQLILGVDRDNAKLSNIFDERNEAVIWALERTIKIARNKGITTSICGQAPSVYPEITQKLVEWGITSISVSPDMIDRTRDIIAEVEERLGIKQQ